MRNVLNIDLRKIVVPEGRLRPVSAARVEELQDSIGKGQLLQPLVVGLPQRPSRMASRGRSAQTGRTKKAEVRNSTLSCAQGQQVRAPTRRD